MRWRGDQALTNLHYRAASAIRLGTIGLIFQAFALSTGCRQNCELVERQNHQLEVALRDARAEVERSHAYNDSLQRELAAVKVVPPAERPLPEVAAQQYSLKSVKLARQTGGVNTDGHLGDDALQVVIETQDVDGHAIKVPGSLLVEAAEVNTEGNKRPISNWLVPPEQMRSRWKTGLFTNGYFVTLPWKAWPETDKLRVTAKFVLSDGRTFEDEKTVTIKPRPQPQRTPLPIDPTDGPQLEVPLPPPRKLPQGSQAPMLDGGRTTLPGDSLLPASVTAELGTPFAPK
jgi:hypothetical protein